MQPTNRTRVPRVTGEKRLKILLQGVDSNLHIVVDIKNATPGQLSQAMAELLIIHDDLKATYKKRGMSVSRES